MFFNRAFQLLAVGICIALILVACGSNAQNQSVIGTAVAQTVEAEQQIPALVVPTNTDLPPLPTLPPTLTSIAQDTPTSGPTEITAPSDPDCIGANLISEYPPDGTVYKPGTQFSKTWTIRNEGTCTWDSSYKLIFWSGETLGGSASYPIPEVVPPGDDVNLTILLQAPATEGTFRGYWRLQTPWNANFGMGQYSQSFYAEILVTKKPGKEYGIIDLTYNIVREPPEGCPVNVLYTVYATITTNGEFDFTYYWMQKDGNDSAIKQLYFPTAGSKTISRSWMIGRGNAQSDRWMRVIIVGPEPIEFPKAVWANNCP